jgi:hypothetical protein
MGILFINNLDATPWFVVTLNANLILLTSAAAKIQDWIPRRVNGDTHPNF